MKTSILKLRAEGKTYNEIINLVGCSKAAVSYHCGAGQKEKTKVRNKQNKSTVKHILNAKIDRFRDRCSGARLQYSKRGLLNIPYREKILSNPVCYLTGKSIDFTKPETYSLDHINPYHISKDNRVENMGLTCREANAAKAHLTLEEFTNLCKEVLEFQGYEILNKNG